MIPLQPTLTVSQLAASHPASMSVLQRHGIDFLGTSKTSLEDVCRQLSLDPIELLAEIRAEEDRQDGDAPVERLVRQMLQAYHHVLREELPRLHRLAQRVLQADAERHTETLTAVLDTFLDLRASVEDHVAREERAQTPLVERVQDPVNGPALAYTLRQEHEAIGSLLRRLRRVTRDFTPPDGAGLPWHELWRGLEGLEVSLHDHVRLVNNVLFLCTVEQDQPRRAEQSS
jgi:regulator of cell morphogenesis and NO signaling